MSKLYDYVPGDGPIPCEVMEVAEAPAKTECQTGIPLTGKTGRENDNLLRRFAGLQREDVYVTNLYKFPLGEGAAKKASITPAITEWAGSELREEIERVNPDIILALGALSTHWFLGDRWDMDTLNAIPHLWEGRIVIPSIHPAASFRDSADLAWIIEAFTAVDKVRKGELSIWTESAHTEIVTDLRDCVGGDRVAIDTETLSDGSPYMVSATSIPGRASCIYTDNAEMLHWLADYVKNPNVLVILQNALFDLPILSRMGIHPHHWHDTMQIAFLLQVLPLGLKALAYRLCGMRMREYEEVVWGRFGDIPAAKKVLPQLDLRDVDEEEREQYSCEDPDATLRVYDAMLPRWYPRMGEVLARDMDIQPMVNAMMERGMKLDVPFMENLLVEFLCDNSVLLDRIQAMAGDGFNPKSAPQVAELLYEKLKLGGRHKIPKTKWGGATGAKVLKKIEGEHPIVLMIEEYRSKKDLIDKSISVLPKYAAGDGRVHTKLSMVRVPQSGRLASSNPNMMAQPVRSEDGRRIRAGFVAEEGFSIVSSDYSQIEMRLTAHVSQDPVLLHIFRTNGDVHTDTAMRTFGIKDPKSVDELKHRYPSKRTGFGVIYRISAMGLSRELMGQGLSEWTEEKCQWMLNSWLRDHPGVPAFWKKIDQEAKRYGQVCDLWGRMKLIPEVKSVYQQTVDAGLRKASNVPSQSGAQGIIKEAMRRMWVFVQEWVMEGLAFPLLQIHDSLEFEVRDDFIPEYISIIKPIEESCVELSVPVLVDFKVGKRWGEMKKWKT